MALIKDVSSCAQIYTHMQLGLVSKLEGSMKCKRQCFDMKKKFFSVKNKHYITENNIKDLSYKSSDYITEQKLNVP